MRLLLFFCAFAGLISADTIPNDGAWIIDRESQLFIYGSTNINNFTCSINNLAKADTLKYAFGSKRRELVFRKNLMSVPVSSFNCSNPLITRDFLETLRAEEYPELEIRFMTLDQATAGNVNGKVKITLAGVSRQYVVRYSLSNLESSRMQLTGKHRVSFSDFNLIAPQKLMGLIKVQETLEVEFQMILRPIP